MEYRWKECTIGGVPDFGTWANNVSHNTDWNLCKLLTEGYSYQNNRTIVFYCFHQNCALKFFCALSKVSRLQSFHNGVSLWLSERRETNFKGRGPSPAQPRSFLGQGQGQKKDRQEGLILCSKGLNLKDCKSPLPDHYKPKEFLPVSSFFFVQQSQRNNLKLKNKFIFVLVSFLPPFASLPLSPVSFPN